ncbi:hypothetical protein RQP46_008294 [Phenoliferia psychrophenolica]
MSSQDPYFEVKSEIESTLLHLSSLLSLPTNVPASERAYNHSELLGTLISLEADLEELEESVHAVEEEGVARRLGIAKEEVARRRAFVERVRGVVRDARQRSGSEGSPSIEARRRLSAHSANLPPPSYHPYEDEEDDANGGGANQFEMEHQTLLITQQDRTLTDISGTVGLLREQAKVMGREVFDQNVMLEALEHDVDRTTGRLGKAQKRLQGFIRENQSSPSSWCILILIAILTILLVVILFF